MIVVLLLIAIGFSYCRCVPLCEDPVMWFGNEGLGLTR